jgi:predicted phosphoribosyltransferase
MTTQSTSARPGRASGPEGSGGPGTTVRFADRRDAGRQLGRLVAAQFGPAELAGTLVVGLTCGGVPVADEVSRGLGLPIDVLAVRRLHLPDAPAVTLGALAEQRAAAVDDHVLRAARVTSEGLGRVVERERAELDRCVRRYRAERPAEPVTGRQVLVVDDGLATGLSALAACRSLAARGVGPIVLAVAVAPPEAARQLHGVADAVLALHTPRGFGTLDRWYAEFGPVGEDDVLDVLAGATSVGGPAAPANGRARRAARAGIVAVPAGGVRLHGDLVSPADARGLVILAHASAGGRTRRECRYLATRLESAGLAGLHLDLLTVAERPWPENLRDTVLLVRRLREATRSMRDDYPWVAYVGVGATADAVVQAAAEPGADVASVVVLDVAASRSATTPVTSAAGTPVLVVPAPRTPADGEALDGAAARICDWLVRVAVPSSQAPPASRTPATTSTR